MFYINFYSEELLYQHGDFSYPNGLYLRYSVQIQTCLGLTVNEERVECEVLYMQIPYTHTHTHHIYMLPSHMQWCSVNTT